MGGELSPPVTAFRPGLPSSAASLPSASLTRIETSPSPPSATSAGVSGAAAGSRTARIAASRFDLPALASPTSAHSGPGENDDVASAPEATHLDSGDAEARAVARRFHTRQHGHAVLITPVRDVRRARTSAPGARLARSRFRVPSARAARGCRRRRGRPIPMRRRERPALARRAPRAPARSPARLRGRADPSSTPEHERCRRTARQPNGQR